jgi:hypothetical protein
MGLSILGVRTGYTMDFTDLFIVGSFVIVIMPKLGNYPHMYGIHTYGSSRDMQKMQDMVVNWSEGSRCFGTPDSGKLGR